MLADRPAHSIGTGSWEGGGDPVDDAERLTKLMLADLVAHPIRPRVLRRAQRLDGGPPGRRRRNEAGPAMSGIGSVLGQPPFGQQVSYALDALPGNAHLAGNTGNGQRPFEHRAEHLPPGCRQPDRPGYRLGGLQEQSVEPERLEHQLRQRSAGRRAVRGDHAAASTANALVSLSW